MTLASFVAWFCEIAFLNFASFQIPTVAVGFKASSCLPRWYLSVQAWEACQALWAQQQHHHSPSSRHLAQQMRLLRRHLDLLRPKILGWRSESAVGVGQMSANGLVD